MLVPTPFWLFASAKGGKRRTLYQFHPFPRPKQGIPTPLGLINFPGATPLLGGGKKFNEWGRTSKSYILAGRIVTTAKICEFWLGQGREGLI